MSTAMLTRLVLVASLLGMTGVGVKALNDRVQYKRPVQVSTHTAPWELRGLDQNNTEYVLGYGNTCAEAQINGAGGHRSWPHGVDIAKCFKVKRK